MEAFVIDRKVIFLYVTGRGIIHIRFTALKLRKKDDFSKFIIVLNFDSYD